MTAVSRRSARFAMLASLCTIAAVACGRTGSTDDADQVSAAARLDSSAGDVSQYSLMSTPVGWLTDSNIVALVAIVNGAPSSLARVESQAWTDQQVHDFALEIIRDHTALQASIDSLVAKRRIPSQLPAVAASMQPGYDSLVTQLSGLSAQDVDRRFLAAEDQIHERTLADFGALAGNAVDPDLRAMLAIRAADMERRHLARSRDFATSMAKADSARQSGKDTTRAKRKP